MISQHQSGLTLHVEKIWHLPVAGASLKLRMGDRRRQQAAVYLQARPLLTAVIPSGCIGCYRVDVPNFALVPYCSLVGCASWCEQHWGCELE
jgi:hypothetical protein